MIMLSSMGQLSAQLVTNKLSLMGAIDVAKEHSSQAMVAQFVLMGQYWSYRSYRANMLPSLKLSSDLMNYDRSIVEDRVGTDIVYVENNSLKNKMQLSLSQNIPFSGGKISINSDISRLDQFDNVSNPLSYNTNPLSFVYSQPLFSFNSLKWKKKTSPKSYEKSKLAYLESMESIAINTATYFFNVLSAQSLYDRYAESYKKRKELYEIAQRRYELGTLKYSEYLQLKLSVLNMEMSVNSSKITLESRLFTLCTYIGLSSYRGIQLAMPFDPSEMTNLTLDYNDVLKRAYTNSSHSLTQELKRLYSEQAVAQAKGSTGLQMNLKVNLGLSQEDSTLPGAYRELKDREIVGLSLSLPIFDWGVGKGDVELAKADLDVTLTEIEVAEQEFRQNIYTKVMEFNYQKRQCEISVIAREISEERYNLTVLRFKNGTASVTELNNAQDDYEQAQTQYINELKSYWVCYYEIQKASLYDYIQGEDITAEFDRIVTNE